MEIDALRKELLDKLISDRERLFKMIGIYRRRLITSRNNYRELGKCICELNGKHDYEWILKESENEECFYQEGKCKVCGHIIKTGINPKYGVQLKMTLE